MVVEWVIRIAGDHGIYLDDSTWNPAGLSKSA